MVSPNVSGEQVSEIPELEDISEEEVETACVEKSRYDSEGGKIESAPKVILTLLCHYLSFYLLFL